MIPSNSRQKVPGQLFSVGVLLCSAALLSGCGDVTPSDAVAPVFSRPARVAAANPTERFYGPERFSRTQGAQDRYSRTISTLRFEGPFTLHVTRGTTADSRAPVAGEVTLDGKRILSQQDFARQSEWSIPVSLGETAALDVMLSGAPGGYLEIWIEGTRSFPVFCPNGPAGSYATLDSAVAAVWVAGTVLVCDGSYSIDRVILNKPLTLRSQNSGGATLLDSDPSQLWQVGRPAIIIDGVASGLVRIADLNFRVGNRGIGAGGTFDRVEIDSVSFKGSTPNLPIAVWVASSTVATAKVEITRSRFDTLSIGVFTVFGVETNVRGSTFATFANSNTGFGSGVTYSSNSVNSVALASYGVAEYNHFSDCAPNGCIRIVGIAVPGRDVTIVHNVMTRLSGSSQANAVFAGRTGTSPVASVILEHNDIIGAAPSGDPATKSSWTVQSFVNVANATVAIARNNRIWNVHTGIIASQNVTAHDNIFTGGYYAVSQLNTFATVDFRRNDVLGFASSLFRPGAGGNAGNYRCNWWGSTAGPAAPSANVSPASYTPWAMAPIATRPDVSCP